MEQNRNFEIIVGFLVIFTSIWFFLYAYNKTGGPVMSNGYTLYARFDNIDGVTTGTEVRISGVKVGSVSKIAMDNQTFLANVTISIDKELKLPVDTEVAVASNGLLGSKYIQIIPGLEERRLKPGEEIIKTRGGQNLESLIGQFILSDRGSEKIKDTKDDEI